MPCGLQDLSSLTRHWTQATAVKAPSPNHWTTRELSTPMVFLAAFISQSRMGHVVSLLVFRLHLWQKSSWICSGKMETYELSACMHAKSLQSCPTLCKPMDCSLPGSSVHGILQAGILQWVAMPSSGDLPHRGMEPSSLISPVLAGGFFTARAPWEALWAQVWKQIVARAGMEHGSASRPGLQPFLPASFCF